MDDLAAGSQSLPPSDVLRFHLEEGARVIVRPSGTEPKLKVYLDVASESGSVIDRRAHGRITLAALRKGAANLL
jgi:phosphomannomutase